MRSTLSRWRDYLTVAGAKLAGTAIALVFSVVSARLLGPEGRGELVSLTTAVALGAQVLNLGLSSALLLEFSRAPGMIRETLGRSWVGAAALCALLAAIGALLARAAPDAPAVAREWWPLAAVWIPVQLLGLFHVSALIAQSRVGAQSAVEIGGRALAAGAGLLALLWFGPRVLPLAWALLAAEAAVAAGIFAGLARAAAPAGEARAAVPAWRRLLPLALRAYPSLLLPFVLLKGDLLLMTALRGAAEAGVYSIAAQMIDLMLVVPGAAAVVALPDVVRARSPRRAALRLAREVALLCTALALIAWIAAPFLIRLVFGEAFAGAAAPFRWLLPGYVLLAIETAAVQYLAARGFPLGLSAAWLAAVVVNLGASAVVIPRYGAVGAAVVSSVSYGLVAALVLRQVLRRGPGAGREPALDPAAAPPG